MSGFTSQGWSWNTGVVFFEETGVIKEGFVCSCFSRHKYPLFIFRFCLFFLAAFSEVL